jgi:hypothetical protein
MEILRRLVRLYERLHATHLFYIHCVDRFFVHFSMYSRNDALKTVCAYSTAGKYSSNFLQEWRMMTAAPNTRLDVLRTASTNTTH